MVSTLDKALKDFGIPNENQRLTVVDTFRKHDERFKSELRLHPRQHKVMFDIEHCRCSHNRQVMYDCKTTCDIAKTPKKVMVIGGGPASMNAAVDAV
ncbi:hypothetical protein [Desulfocicer niacini]